MEKTIKLIGNIEEMEQIFNNSKKISIRYYKPIHQNRYEIIVRFNENLETSISTCKSIKNLIKIDNLEQQCQN